jgi:hypothetical protein
MHSSRPGRSFVVVGFVVTAWVLAAALSCMPETYHTNASAGAAAAPRGLSRAQLFDRQSRSTLTRLLPASVSFSQRGRSSHGTSSAERRRSKITRKPSVSPSLPR